MVRLRRLLPAGALVAAAALTACGHPAAAPAVPAVRHAPVRAVPPPPGANRPLPYAATPPAATSPPPRTTPAAPVRTPTATRPPATAPSPTADRRPPTAAPRPAARGPRAPLPAGTHVTLDTPQGTLSYHVYANYITPGQGGPDSGLYWGDLTLQTCVGADTGFSYLSRDQHAMP